MHARTRTHTRARARTHTHLAGLVAGGVLWFLRGSVGWGGGGGGKSEKGWSHILKSLFGTLEQDGGGRGGREL